MRVLHVNETQRQVEVTREFNPLSSHRPSLRFLQTLKRVSSQGVPRQFKQLQNESISRDAALLHLPDGHLSVVFASSAEDVPVFRRAERRHLVVVAVELLQDLVALCVQDVDLAFGGTAANTADPYLVFNFDHAGTSGAVLERHAVMRFGGVLNVPNAHFS